MRKISLVLEGVERMLELVEGQGSIVVMLERRVEELEAQNKELFDRLMARDWDSFATRPEAWRQQGLQQGQAVPGPLEDLENAGEIMEIEE